MICRQCKNEISVEESYFNQNLCDECLFSTDDPAQSESAGGYDALVAEHRQPEEGAE